MNVARARVRRGKICSHDPRFVVTDEGQAPWCARCRLMLAEIDLTALRQLLSQQDPEMKAVVAFLRRRAGLTSNPVAVRFMP